MDTDLLVGTLIDDGRWLLRFLANDHFEVSVAFWARVQADGSWNLFLATPHLPAASEGSASPYIRVYSALDQLPNRSISAMDVSLLEVSNPIAIDAVAVRDRYPARGATHIRSKLRLGNLTVAEAYIYPTQTTLEGNPAGSRHGARVYLLGDRVALVRQTVRRSRPQGDRYVSERDHEQHVDLNDDAALGKAVRAALEGRL